jgi:hypothetical protein
MVRLYREVRRGLRNRLNWKYSGIPLGCSARAAGAAAGRHGMPSAMPAAPRATLRRGSLDVPQVRPRRFGDRENEMRLLEARRAEIATKRTASGLHGRLDGVRSPLPRAAPRARWQPREVRRGSRNRLTYKYTSIPLGCMAGCTTSNLVLLQPSPLQSGCLRFGELSVVAPRRSPASRLGCSPAWIFRCSAGPAASVRGS